MAASPPRSWAPSATFPCTEVGAAVEVLAAHLKIPRLPKTAKSSLNRAIVLTGPRSAAPTKEARVSLACCPLLCILT